MEILRALLIGLLIVFPFGQATRIPLPFISFPEAHLYFLDILVFLLVYCWLFWHLISKKGFLLPNFWRWWLLFISLLLLSWLINFKNFQIKELIVGLLYWFRFVFYSLLSLVIFDLKYHNVQIKKIIEFKIFSFLILILTLVGLAQYLLIPDMRFLFPLGWDLHYYRLVGFYLDPNFMGILLVLGILGVLVNVTKNKVNIMLAILGTISLLLTYSRSSYLALFAGVIILLYLKNKKKLIFYFLFSFSFLMFLLPRPGGEGVRLERTASISQRLVSWQEALKIWQKSPIFGIGFNNYRYVSRNFGYLSAKDWQINNAGAGVENSFLFLLATGGVLGLLGLFGWLKSIIREALFLKNKKNRDLILSSLVAILVHSLFINSFFYPWVMVWWSFLLGNIN